MNIVDSSAWLSWISDDRNANHFAGAILDVKNLLVPTITLTEVFKCIARQAGERKALQAVTQMSLGKVAPLDARLAVDAAGWGLKLKLPLADSIIYATAQRFHAVIWTLDSDFKELPGVKFFP